MFLIRTAFWLSLVIMFLPAGNIEGETDDITVGAVDALSAAQTTYGDLAKFCERNESTCQTGSIAISSFGQKARYGAQIVYEYLDNQFGSDEQPKDDSEKS